MRTETVTWDNATITVSEPTGWTAMFETHVHLQIATRIDGTLQSAIDVESGNMMDARMTKIWASIVFFKRAICQSKITGNIGIELPHPNATGDTLWEGYIALMGLPKPLIEAWKKAAHNVSTDPVETELSGLDEGEFQPAELEPAAP